MSSKRKEAPETRGLYRKTCCISRRLDGKIALVTGASTHVGFMTTCELARRGARVIMGCPDTRLGDETRKMILCKWGPSDAQRVSKTARDVDVETSLSPIATHQLWVELIDLASLQSIRDFAERFKSMHLKLDLLIHTATQWTSKYTLTQDNLELTMSVNYLGPFLLTELLIPLLVRAPQGRILFVSSRLHKWSSLKKPDLQLNKKEFGSFRAYCQSKLAMVVYAAELGKRLGSTHVLVASVDPALVREEIKGHLKAKDDDDDAQCQPKAVDDEKCEPGTEQPKTDQPRRRKRCMQRCTANFVSMFKHFILALLWPFLVTPWQAVQTILFASLSSSIVSGAYYSNCTQKKPASNALDEATQQWLRNRSYELVGLTSQCQEPEEPAEVVDPIDQE